MPPASTTPSANPPPANNPLSVVLPRGAQLDLLGRLESLELFEQVFGMMGSLPVGVGLDLAFSIVELAEQAGGNARPAKKKIKPARSPNGRSGSWKV